MCWVASVLSAKTHTHSVNESGVGKHRRKIPLFGSEKAEVKGVEVHALSFFPRHFLPCAFVRMSSSSLAVMRRGDAERGDPERGEEERGEGG